MDMYPSRRHVNSQQAEQVNRELRKLGTVLAFAKWDNYKRKVEMYLARRNLIVKGLL